MSAGGRVVRALRGTGLLMRWHVRRQASLTPALIVVQGALAIATVLGFGLLIGDTTPETALLLGTGAPTITLITIGLVVTPQATVQARTEGSVDWLRSLPLPRWTFLAADLILWSLLALPGLALGLLIAGLRFSITFVWTPWLLPAVLLISLTSAAIGYAFASVLPAMLTQMVTQLLVFLVLLFSPISYPASHLPDWLQHVHEVLPIQSMATLMRAGLAGDDFTATPRDLITVALWCAAAVTGALLALHRRR